MVLGEFGIEQKECLLAMVFLSHLGGEWHSLVHEVEFISIVDVLIHLRDGGEHIIKHGVLW